MLHVSVQQTNFRRLKCMTLNPKNNMHTIESIVLIEKLTVSQLVQNFPAFYGTRRFITVFIRVRHLSLS